VAKHSVLIHAVTHLVFGPDPWPIKVLLKDKFYLRNISQIDFFPYF